MLGVALRGAIVANPRFNVANPRLVLQILGAIHRLCCMLSCCNIWFLEGG
jgi:hypothetical protein